MNRLIAGAIAAIASVATLAAVGFGAGSASRGERSGCDPKRSRTVIETDDARVFTRRVRGTPRMYGCWFDHGRPYLLGSRGVDEFEDWRARLAGRYVAYVWYSRTAPYELRVFDIRRGKRVRVAVHYPAEEDFEIGSFVVNDRGSVAWIVLNRQRDKTGTFSVHRQDSNGLAKLDEGDISPGSLAIADDWFLRGSTIYWRWFGGDGGARAADLD